MHEQHRVGIQYLQDVTTLVQRVRPAHPTAGQFDAADFQWWWRTPRSTDDHSQLFWFDDAGRPEAAAIATDCSDGIALSPITMPKSSLPQYRLRTGQAVRRGISCELAMTSDHVASLSHDRN